MLGNITRFFFKETIRQELQSTSKKKNTEKYVQLKHNKHIIVDFLHEST